MNRQILYLILFLIGLVYYLFAFTFNKQRQVFNAIPNSAVVLLDIHDWDKCRNKLNAGQYFQDMLQLESLDKMADLLYIMDSLFLQNKLQTTKKMVTSLHVTSANQFDFLLTTHKSNLIMPLNRITEELNRKGYTIQKRNLKKAAIYEIIFKNTKKASVSSFTIAQNGQTVSASLSPILVDEAISSGKRNDFYTQTHTADKLADATIHINPAKLSGLFQLFFNDNTTDKNALLNNIKLNLKWLQYSIALDKKEIFLDGYTSLFRQKAFWKTVLKQKGTNNIHLPQYLPANTAILTHFRVPDINDVYSWSMGGVFKRHTDWIGPEWGIGI